MNNDAFVPKPFIFLHCCMNCKYARKAVGAAAVVYGYYCERLDDQKIPWEGTHICNVEPGDGDGNQLKWELKEEKEEK